MNIEFVSPKELKPNPKNRNKHPKEQIERLAKIISEQGFRRPIVVSNQSGMVVVGHGRLMAAKKLGLEKVPVIYQDYATPELEYADQVADNAVALWAELDIIGINSDLPDLGPDFDIDLLGIKNFTLDVSEKEYGCDEDEVPEHVEPKTKLGDIYQLGNHRLMCGDSTSVDAVEKLMNGEKADMVFTDPPYGVEYEGGQNKKTNKKLKQISGDALTGKQLSNLFQDSVSNALLITKNEAAFYIWFSTNKSVETFAGIGLLNLTVRSVIAWYKINSRIGSFMSQYIPNYEPCIYAFKNGCSPQWFGPSDEKAVWEIKKVGDNTYHPTQKPVELPERAINNSSKSGDIVLDLFGGSGSTLIACEKTNRKCFMMELDCHYVSVIIERYIKYTGRQDVYLLNEDGSKTSWSEVCEKRR